MKLLTALFFATTMIVSAQSIEVPHKMKFADLTLTIRDDARKEIQKDVDAFTRYPKSFNVKVERARIYFPIIEKIFAEENVPDDFKYLVLQESALIADAVSVSNAVGYWQFKDFTAIEMGLRVDKHVDERMNIVASTRGAARYLKKNNTFFNNWLYALQAYQMGAGGVLRSVKDSKSGVKHLDITSDTYWYVKKYLAHKIAYEGFVKGSGEVQLLTYETQKSKKTLSEIAKEVNVDEEQLKEYNKWIKSSSIPDDRSYAVALPVKGDPSGIKLPEAAVASNTTVTLHEKSTKSGTFKTAQSRIKVNGIAAIRAEEQETPTALASRAGVDLSAFLKWNDISISDRLKAGNYYLLGKKRSRASTAYHKVSEGESLWSISQQYGVQIKKLKKYNRLGNNEEVRPGTTLWLSSTKPKNSPKEAQPEKVIQVNTTEEFAWEVKPAEHSGTAPQTTTPQATPQVTTPTENNAAKPLVESAPVKEDVSETKKPSADDTLITADASQGQPVPVVQDKVNKPAESESKVVVVEARPDSVLVATPTNPAPTNQVVTNPEEHVVQQGETLYGIARTYKLGVMDLVNWNNLDLQQGIKPGQVIRLRDPEAGSEETVSAAVVNIIHEVKASDTVYSIARKYGVTIRELMEWNNKKDFNLSVGEKLTIVRK